MIFRQYNFLFRQIFIFILLVVCAIAPGITIVYAFPACGESSCEQTTAQGEKKRGTNQSNLSDSQPPIKKPKPETNSVDTNEILRLCKTCEEKGSDKENKKFSDAVNKEDMETIALLCNSKNAIDFNVQNSDGNTALMLAINKGETELACRLIKKPDIDVNKKNKEGWTVLMMSCKEHNVHAVEMLADSDKVIDWNTTNDRGETALIMSTLKSCSSAIAKILIHKKNVDVNARDVEGYTALFHSCIHLANNYNDLPQLPNNRDPVYMQYMETRDTIRAILSVENVDLHNPTAFDVAPLSFVLYCKEQEIINDLIVKHNAPFLEKFDAVKAVKMEHERVRKRATDQLIILSASLVKKGFFNVSLNEKEGTVTFQEKETGEQALSCAIKINDETRGALADALETCIPFEKDNKMSSLQKNARDAIVKQVLEGGKNEQEVSLSKLPTILANYVREEVKNRKIRTIIKTLRSENKA